MLATLRRQQKGILIVVAVIVTIAFAWLYDSTDYDQPALMEAFSVYGRKYRISEAQKLMRTYDIGLRLGLYEFTMMMAGRQQQQQQQQPDSIDYAINLLVLRNQSKALGILPSEEGIAEFVKELPVFRTAGQYNSESFKTFSENYLTPNGFSLTDLSQIAGDAICFNRIQELVGSNVHAASDVVDEYFARDYTEFTASRVDFPRVNYEGVTVSDEEVKTYYEANKANLQSDPKRSIEYVSFVKPEKTEEMSDEDYAAKMKEFGEKVNRFALEVLAEGANFAALAKEHGIELKRPDAFSLAEPPEELDGAFELLSDVFRRTLSVPISDPFNTEKGYYVYNLLAVVDSQPLTLEEATPRIREQLKNNAVARSMSLAANGARARMLAALKEGKTFQEAAGAEGLKVIEIPAFSRAEPPSALPDAQTIAGVASNLEKGDISSVLNNADGAYLIYVSEKSPLADETAQLKKDEIADQIRQFDGRLLFQSWFQKVREAAGARRPAEELASQ